MYTTATEPNSKPRMAYPALRVAIFVFLFLQQNLFSAADALGVAERTCKQNRRDSRPAIIATEQAEKEFQHVWDAVEKLQHANVTDPDKEALMACSEVYDDGVDVLTWAIKFIMSRSKSDAITYLSAALTDVTTYDDGFDDFGNKKLVAKMNEDPRNSSRLTLANASAIVSSPV
ncbi:hypothetical protein HPP92_003928 [Vanilla planifolia]|uniref:Pectinesterase inhibitor domain-containing protein n=1 Tax=Vanilla planifolia TaxID=51239 RepID=A0A835S4K5_VANPL|nr:hypothetical protein HPP92_004343 [Vanilla planifolia]KAG0503856.1 hypothetical protein HPP92_003928 [Vanilla planifolia]